MVDWQVGVDAGCRDGVEDVDEARGELTEVERRYALPQTPQHSTTISTSLSPKVFGVS